MRATRGSVFGADGWELRVAGRCLRDDLGLPESALANDHASTRLAALLTSLDPSTDAFGPLGTIAVLAHESDAIAVWGDDEGTRWVLASGNPSEIEARVGAGRLMLPGSEDRWRQHGDRLAAWIDDVRVSAPLLLARARAARNQIFVFPLERGELSIGAQDDVLYVGMRIGLTCTARERARLAAVVIAAVRPVPGWRPADGLGADPPDPHQLVFRLEGT